MTIRDRIEATSLELRKHLLDEFSQKLLFGALAGYSQSQNPVRLNQFSGTLRELISHTLDILAPSEHVTKCSWVKEEAGRPTRRQRIVYATQGGLSDKAVSKLEIDTEDIHKECVGAINDLSKFTHVRPNTLVEDQAEIDAFVSSALSAFLALFHVLNDCRKEVIYALQNEIDAKTIEKFTSQTIQELDELSTHTFVDFTSVESMEVVSIDSTHVNFRIEGSVYVVLQYGSDGDRRRGDGASINDDYPFVILMSTKVDKLGHFENIKTEVDNSSFFE